MIRIRTSLLAAFALILAIAPTTPRAGAAMVTAFSDSIIQPGGARTANSGATLVNYFLNVEGAANGNFASFAVADFSGLKLGINSLAQLGQFQLALTEFNAGFSAPGPIAVYLSTDTTTGIGLTTPLRFTAGTSQGLGTQLNNAVGNPLGNFQFTRTGSSVGSGTVDTIDLTAGLSSLSSSTQAALLASLDNGGTIRLVLASTDPTGNVAATFAGIGNTNYPNGGPALIANVINAAVPEPASLALVGCGLAGIALVLRRRATRAA